MAERKIEPKSNPSGGAPGWRFSIGYFLVMLVLLFAWQEMFSRLAERPITYAEFKTAIASNEVKSVSISAEEITGRIQPGPGLHRSQINTNVNWPATSFEFRAIRVEDANLVQ